MQVLRTGFLGRFYRIFIISYNFSYINIKPNVSRTIKKRLNRIGIVLKRKYNSVESMF